MKRRSKVVRVSFRLDHALISGVRKQAKREARTLTAWVERALGAGLERARSVDTAPTP